MELALVARAKAGDAARCREAAGCQALAHGSPLDGHHQIPDPSVARMGLPFDQSPRFEPVDEASDVRRIAFQPRRQLAHQQWTIGLKLAEGHGLSRRQFELRGRRAEVAVNPIERDPDEQAPNLIGEFHLD